MSRLRPAGALTIQQRAAAEELLREHADELWRIAIVVGGSRQAAEDLLSAAILRALPHLHRITGPPGPYLRRVMLNLRSSQWRRDELGQREPTADEADPDAADLVARRTDLARALDRLAPRQRAVLILRYLEDLDVAAVAALLQCSEGTVRSQALRGLANLRRHSPDLLASYHFLPRSTP